MDLCIPVTRSLNSARLVGPVLETPRVYPYLLGTWLVLRLLDQLPKVIESSWQNGLHDAAGEMIS